MTLLRKEFLPHAVIALVAILSMMLPGVTSSALLAASAWFFRYFDWLTLVATGGAILFCLAVAVLPVGRLRIGGREARPEFRTVTWFAMLFAAGMGAGLVFWGAAEPLIFYLNPPPGGPEAATPAARFEALALTQFHWSIHAWAVYAVAALAVAISAGRKEAPLPSAPFPDHRVKMRRLIDWLAILAVIFGIVASIGQGVIQMGAGTELISDGKIKSGPGVQMVLLLILSAVFLFSAARGLRRGIAVLSNINLVLALMLAGFVLVMGPTGEIISTFFSSIKAYGERLLSLSVTLRPEGEGRDWTRAWSLTYFLWWIAWTPFVGVFIARISRGRSLREFVGGVVLVPVAVTLVWFSIFGGTALSLTAAGADLGVTNFDTAPAATYALLEYLPLTRIVQGIAFTLVFVFLLTSADSGAYVLAMFSRGAASPPVPERLYWGVIISVLTAGAVLSAQGQTVTRAFAVTGAIPLTILLMAQAIAVSWQHIREGRIFDPHRKPSTGRDADASAGPAK
ncbi:BCCT family transporter [Parvularcula marina]|nr:BCCT family transporter [Parvularcula marina]